MPPKKDTEEEDTSELKKVCFLFILIMISNILVMRIKCKSS